MKRISIMSLGLGMAVLLVLTGTGIATPMEMDQSSESFVDQILHSWRGFATNDHESHVLRVSIESVSLIEPTQIRKLLAVNSSVEEIYDQIRKERGEVTSKGYLRLGKAITGAKSNPEGTDILNFTVGSQGIYELVNMKMSSSGNYTIIDSDVAERGYSEQNRSAKIMGHMTVNIADLDPDRWAELSEGQLTMNGGPFPGKYKVLLETQSRESTFGNTSWGINLLDQEDLLDQAYGPSMNVSQSEDLS
ncbi:MAG: hypothetical protein WA141_00700 [Methanothrix sp.]|uniref:hypothetical protein n=1 Tax=Methanothrix sp. TaxID=90426 RepID=UPI003BB7BFC9